MTTWDPTRYLQFADDRSRPFVDLVARVQGEPATIVDLGCGPGHLTAVLRGRWPEATIHGVDSSPDMIDKANADNADDRATYELADVATWTPPEPVDLIVSNALFQWVPDQLAVIQRLASLCRAGRHVRAAGAVQLRRAEPPVAARDLVAASVRRAHRRAARRPRHSARGVPRPVHRARLDGRRVGDDLPARPAGRGPGLRLDLRHRRAADPAGAARTACARSSSPRTRPHFATPIRPDRGARCCRSRRTFAVARREALTPVALVAVPG